MPKVSVLLPVYNSDKYIRESIDSIISQSFADWEMIIINEFGSNEVCTEIVRDYEKKEKRIRVIQNTTRLGLAESLNLGMREASGEYIARMDADDISHVDRLKKQVEYLDKNKSVAVVGSYQHHFGQDIDWVHKPPTDKEQCKANIVFFCDLCHSTLMLRRATFIENNLFYDNNYLAEDFELWSRVILYGDIANIGEILGEYRVGEDNITASKKEKLHLESGSITAKTIKNTLGIKVENDYVFNSWRNDFKSKESYSDLKKVLLDIYSANKKIKFFDESSLLRSIRAKWGWAYLGEPFNKITDVSSIYEVFNLKRKNVMLTRFIYFWNDNRGVKKKIRKIVKKMLQFARRE